MVTLKDRSRGMHLSYIVLYVNGWGMTSVRNGAKKQFLPHPHEDWIVPYRRGVLRSYRSWGVKGGFDGPTRPEMWT